MKACLIKCASPFLIDEKVFPPLGLMAVGTVFQNQGYEVYIHDDPAFTIPLDCQYYGLGPTTPEYPEAIAILRYIKERNEKAQVVIGGPHANTDCWRDGFDWVVIGDVADENLIIDRTLLNIRDYKYFIDDKLATTLVTTMGCPYKCAFCSKTSSTIKFKNVEKVIEEIKILHHEFGYKALMFFDDIFIFNQRRLLRICECLKELGIIWRCFVRADLVIQHGDKLLNIMADSGCVEVGMGIESGSDIILNNINKGESIATIRYAIEMIQDKGVRIKGFFIIGLPGENCQSLSETWSFLENTRLDDADFTVFRPYPGSPIYKNKEKYDIQWSDLDYSQMFYKGKPGEYYPLISTSGLSSEQIIAARDTMERHYGC